MARHPLTSCHVWQNLVHARAASSHQRPPTLPTHPHPPLPTFMTLFQSSLDVVLRCGFWREK